MRNYLTKENINTISGLKTQEIELPELELTVIIKELSASQILSIQDLAKDNQEESVFRIIAMSVVDADGNRLVSNADAKKVFGSWSTASIQTLTNSIMALNKIDRPIDKAITDTAGELENDPLAVS